MASTKIINVLKDDSFNEILDIFKSTPASEVIFVLPKRSKAFQKEAHFIALREEANSSKKTASFLCSNPDLNDIAKKYDFDVLLSRPSSPRQKTGKVNVVNQIEDFYESAPARVEPATAPRQPAVPDEEPEEDKEVDEEEQKEDDSADEPVVASAVSRRMDDIIDTGETENHRNVKVSTTREKQYDLDVHHELAAEREIDEEAVASMWRPDFINKKYTAKQKPELVRSSSSRPRRTRLMVALGAGALLIVGVVVYATTGTAEVTLQPKSSPVDFSLTVAASDAVSAVDLAHLKIPGQLFHIEKMVSKVVTATGEKNVAQKARGDITIYNETNTSQSLIATTRFESTDGHVFHTLTNVIVPPAKNTTTPGTVNAQIIADKAGSDYNVPAGTLTVMAFKEKGDTVKFQHIYGKSTAAIHGGTSGKATVVTESDYNTAKDDLVQQLKASVGDELNLQTNGLKVLSQSALVIAAPTSTASIDDAADTFTMTLKGSLATVGFKEFDVQAVIAQYVDTKYNLHVEQGKITVTYNNDKFDPATNTLSMGVAVKGVAYAKVDQKNIIADLIGKQDQAIKDYLQNVPGITTANVVLSPLWVRSIPKDQSRVHINLNY